uniref:hypothetical protein n=1 Tax=Candidatus Enterococcus willemsii TaxID=1857215 RepID=UPI00403F0AE5
MAGNAKPLEDSDKIIFEFLDGKIKETTIENFRIKKLKIFDVEILNYYAVEFKFQFWKLINLKKIQFSSEHIHFSLEYNFFYEILKRLRNKV